MPMNTGDDDMIAPKRDIAIDARRVVAEVTVILESVAGGLEALASLPEAVLVRTQIGILRGLVTMAAQTVEAFGEALATG